MNARSIAHALGGRRATRIDDHSFLTCCPVASHGRRRGDLHPSLQVTDGDRRLLVRCYADCDARDVLDELRRRGLLERPTRSTPAKQAPPPRTADNHERRQHEKAAWLWSQRRPIAGTIAETYLRGRHISCALPLTLAFLSPTKPGRHPAMIAAFAIPDETEPGVLGQPRDVNAVHLTLLKPDGAGKANVERPKLFIGSPGGRPIVLAPPNDLLGLAITEGIEDALTAHQATGLVVWAAGAAGFMPALADKVPDYIEAITIYAHSDKAGRDGAHKLAQKLRARGIEIFLEGIM
jgi:hypothetical protein